jgi:hypothetical protein
MPRVIDLEAFGQKKQGLNSDYKAVEVIDGAWKVI